MQCVTLAQEPLTDDGACEGGLLLFACPDGRLLHVQRRVGSIMAHDGDAVHGVTQLVKGIRCGLHHSLMQRIAFSCFFDSSTFFLHLPPVTAARYGLYALRRRSSAEHEPSAPNLRHEANEAVIWRGYPTTLTL